MAVPAHNPEYDQRKQDGKKLIAAGGCSALSLWSRTDAVRLCPPEHMKEVDFAELEPNMFISEWLDAAKRAVVLIQRGIDLIERDYKNK